jgi:HSP20 family protein
MPKRQEMDLTKEKGEPWGLPSLFMTTRPTIDMDEDENEIRITAEMPGLEKGDFKVELTGRQLAIRGEKKETREEKKKNAYYSERSYGAFARSISLPSEVDPDKVEANYKNGILNIRLPKTEQSKVKRIDVQVS